MSDAPRVEAPPASAVPPALERPDGFSLALNYLPLALLALGAAVAWQAGDGAGARLGAFVAWLYLVPPLIGRVVLAAYGRPEGRFALGSRGYRVWWCLAQLQMPFNRLPWLDELLRLVPGLYSAWIALWGGRLSPLGFVSPGVRIIDRHLVLVGRGAVLGMKSTLTGHAALRDEAGRFVVVVGTPTVGREAIVGGEAGIGPGATLHAGAVLPAGRRLGPGAQWPRPAAAEVGR